MKVILVMVISLNGKITKGDDPDISSWTSQEDKDFFYGFLKTHQVVVMGSKTYEAARHNFTKNDDRLRIVMTSDPIRYKDDNIDANIKYTNDKPSQILKRLEQDGYTSVLLLGGGQVNKDFLNAGLVDELYITVEPMIFGKGKPVIAEGDFFCDLTLVSVEKLNRKGTLLLHYTLSR